MFTALIERVLSFPQRSIIHLSGSGGQFGSVSLHHDYFPYSCVERRSVFGRSTPSLSTWGPIPERALSLHIPCRLITQIYSFPRLCGISLAGFIFDPHHQTQKWTIWSFVYNNLFLCYIRPSVVRVENFKGLVMWNDVVCLIGRVSESFSAGDLSKCKTYIEPFPFGPSMCSLQTDLSKFTLIALTLLFTEQNNERSIGSSPQFDSSEIKDQRVRFHYEAISFVSCAKSRLPSFSSYIAIALDTPRMFACMPNATKA